MEAGATGRSADAYFINRRAYNDYVHRLQQGVVDYDVLPSPRRRSSRRPADARRRAAHHGRADVADDDERVLAA